jgi:hypothetical protein
LHLGSGRKVLTGVYALSMHVAKLKDARSFEFENVATLSPPKPTGTAREREAQPQSLENPFSVAGGK